MNIDQALVKRIAELSQLRLSDDELGHYSTKLTQVINYVAQLDELKLSDESDAIESFVFEREDIVESSLAVERSMQEAPRKIGSAFQVPRILE